MGPQHALFPPPLLPVHPHHPSTTQGRPGSHRYVLLIEFCVIQEQSKHAVLKGEHASEWEPAAQAGGVATGTQLLPGRKEKTVPMMGFHRRALERLTQHDGMWQGSLLSFRLKLAKGHIREGCRVLSRRTYLLHRAPKHHCPGFVIPDTGCTLLSLCYRLKELELGLLALLLEKLALTRQAPGPGRHCKQTSQHICQGDCGQRNLTGEEDGTSVREGWGDSNPQPFSCNWCSGRERNINPIS